MNLKHNKSPCCDSAHQRSDMNNTLNEYSLMAQILSDQNMRATWKHVKANKGAPSIDKMSIEECEPFLLAHWQGIKEKLITGNYYPLPVRRVTIPKSDGGERLLGIPAVIDRIIQQAISQMISPYFEPIFSPYSYGYRPNKSAKQAVIHVQTCIKQGYRTAVDIDLSKFFDEVNHDMLMNRVGRKIKDKALMQLLGRFFTGRYC